MAFIIFRLTIKRNKLRHSMAKKYLSYKNFIKQLTYYFSVSKTTYPRNWCPQPTWLTVQCSTPQYSRTPAPAVPTVLRRPWATWWMASKWCTGHQRTPPSTRATRITRLNTTATISNGNCTFVHVSICLY